ncbi:biosynthetic arginine decarboxylase [Maritalea porphyrae]|uniref:biosynthetic arginine decarboxylase n=1 Tax=Maritalea porphyrae TaxID=880732 RepID=UPI0022AE536F|nr:biosynthetic arginine decarboxylase [Maritalea porphyrae]MCZ4271869.1 biosynthetic arginine decarboxylase [Maritalea porphyrae]
METRLGAEIYGIDRWGHKILTVLPNGDAGLVDVMNPKALPVSIPSIVNDLAERGIHSPILLRVNSFLQNSLIELNQGFAKAIDGYKYGGDYRGVFPIKVNQQAEVVERIVETGRQFSYGLEVGSKPELLIALSQNLAKDSLLICNGVKDEEFIRLAILSCKIGFNTIIVLESPKELDLVIRVSKALGEKPRLGARIKLTHQITGYWAESSGDRSTFGMTTDNVVAVTERLKAEGMEDCLILQHSHLGSQISDINDVRRIVQEACRFYTELKSLGMPLKFLDLGGGLGIDYTGEKQSNENSVNYSLPEYCEAIVETVKYAMDEAKIEHPNIVTESGRGVVALSSMLIFDVLDATLYDSATLPETGENAHHLIKDLLAIQGYLSTKRLQECVNDAIYYRDEVRALFRRGNMDIKSLAQAETVFRYLVAQFKTLAADAETSAQLEEQLGSFADIYHGNFSLFQSLPDVWAIDQLHPIMPLQRLNETPHRQAMLSDITCDSDGKIDRFVLADGISKTLPVHDLKENEDYYIGVFFVGAYQETLGDLHNLFGDTNVVTVALGNDGNFDLLHEVEGDTISEVLEYVEYEAQTCLATFRKRVDNAVSEKKLSISERRVLIAAYKDSLSGYTYFEK